MAKPGISNRRNSLNCLGGGCAYLGCGLVPVFFFGMIGLAPIWLIIGVPAFFILLRNALDNAISGVPPADENGESHSLK